MKKIWLTIILFLLGFTSVNLASAGGGPILMLSPSSGNYTNGSTFKVTMKINSGSVKSMAVDVFLSFDQSKLEIVSVDNPTSPAFNFSMGKNIYNSQGKLDLSFNPSGDSILGESEILLGDLAVITFKAKSAGLAQVKFTCQAGSTIDTNIFDNQGNDVINCVGNQNGSYTIYNSTPTATPTKKPTPTPTKKPSPTPTPESISCRVHSYLVSKDTTLPYKYDGMEIVAGSNVKSGDYIIYAFEIINAIPQRQVVLREAEMIQMLGGAEPLQIVAIHPPNGNCKINSANKSANCNLSYSFFDNARNPIEYLVKITEPGKVVSTSSLFTLKTDAGTTKCASYLQLKGSPPVTGDSILNYKVAFANVNGNNAKCLVDWPLQFIVIGGRISRAYSEVLPQSRTVVDGKLIFSGSLILTDFQEREGLAVFIKGPKHLQMKYGKDQQVGSYGQAGGEITLTVDADTSPVYDFTRYPIMAGDVTGVTSEAQDGWINGVDFSYIKSKSLVHETVATGGYLRGDLDGNCQVNSNDVNILKISLQAKQGELY